MLERRDIGEMREARLEVSAALIDQLGDQLLVRVIDIDKQGKISLTRKDLLPPDQQ